MIRLMMALACTMAFTQVAEAAAVMSVSQRNARELAAVRSQDPNMPGTKAWKKDQVDRKATCNTARHHGDRDANTAPTQVAEAAAARGADGRQSVR